RRSWRTRARFVRRWPARFSCPTAARPSPGDPRLAILRSFARAFTAFTALTLSQTQWTKQCTHGGQLRAILCRRFGCCNSAADKELGERRTLGADTLNCPHGEKAL